MFEHLKGKDYYMLVRCSTNPQEGTSDVEQIFVNQAFADLHGMGKCLHIERAIGVSGSETFNRHDIENLMKLARERNEVSVLLIHDLSRLTRGGVDHGAKLQHEFRTVGIEIVSAKDNIPDTIEGQAIKAMYHFSNAILPRRIAWGVVLGRVGAFLAGRVTGGTVPPFGCDRLVLGLDNLPFQRHRLYQDTRQVLDPTGTTVLDTHFRGISGKMPAISKMKEQKSMFIPGTPAHVELVNWIWERKYLDDWGCNRIANALNSQRGTPDYIAPMFSADWQACTIENIIHQPLYIGYCEVAKVTKAKFNRWCKMLPLPALIKQETLEGEGRKRVPPLRLPKDSWIYREEPQMKEYIRDPRVRELAQVELTRYWDGFYERRELVVLEERLVRNNRHPNSTYFLSGTLTTNMSKLKMFGKSQRLGARYYYSNVAKALKVKGHPERRVVNAQPIEQAVLEILRSVWSKSDLVTDAVRKYVDEEIGNANANDERRIELNSKLRKYEDKIDALLEINSEVPASKLRGALDALRMIKEKAESELRAIEATPSLDPDSVCQRVEESMFPATAPIDPDQAEYLRALVRSVTRKLEIDMDTFEIDFEVQVPPWLLSGPNVGLADMHVVTRSFEAHKYQMPILGRFRAFRYRIAKNEGYWRYRWYQLPDQKAA